MDCREILKYEISWKSIQREPSFPYGPTDKAKLIVASHNFANAPKSGTELLNTLHDLTSLDVDTDDDDDDDDNDNKDDKFHFVSQCAYVRTRKHF
jgi:hypothetical protein